MAHDYREPESLIITLIQYFIRLNTASTIANRMKYDNDSVADAAISCVDDLRINGGIGGVIALDNEGHGEHYTYIS